MVAEPGYLHPNLLTSLRRHKVQFILQPGRTSSIVLFIHFKEINKKKKTLLKSTCLGLFKVWHSFDKWKRKPIKIGSMMDDI